MSVVGYNGRHLKILKDGVAIAAVRTKTMALGRTPIDVTNDDSDGYQILLPAPGMRSANISVEGVATVNNYQAFLADWEADAFLDVTVQHPDGTSMEAEHGFFLGNIEMSGEHDGYVAFTAELQSSGPVNAST